MTFLIKRNIPKKLKLLKEQSSFPLFSDEKFLYKEIDLERCKGVKLAEKKCRKLRMGQVSFSQELQQARQKIRAWHPLDKEVKDLCTSSRLLCRTLLKANLPPDSREKIRQHLHEAYKAYYKVKGSHKELCASHTDNLAEALAEASKMSKENVIKLIRQREKQRFTARKIKFLRGKLSGGSTTMVTIQQEDGTHKDITGKNNIEEAIMASNNLKFQQSFHTAFMQSPLREEFGFKVLTVAAHAALGGIYEPHDLIDQYTYAVIEELNMPQAVRDIGPQKMALTLDSYRNF
jgi:hypothetical protein